jgi:hypothetical protein
MTFADRNRLNAQSSTGPRTPEGKAASSMNAVKTGLTGRTVLLPSDDVAAFEAHIKKYFDEYQPVGLRENELVQSLADTRWRLDRIFALEAAIFALAGTTPKDEEAPLSELDIYLKYEKQLRNLHTQESRLNRRYAQEQAELKQLQQQRRAESEGVTSLNSTKQLIDKKDLLRQKPASGFVFTNQPSSPANPSTPNAMR